MNETQDTLSIKDILGFQSKNKISDIHLISGETPCIRSKAGEILELDKKNISSAMIDLFLEEMLNQKELEKVQKKRTGNFAKNFEGIEGRFRINVFDERRGLGMNIRFISNNLPSIDELQITDGILDVINNRTGLFLITGPNNSGKTTLMNSLIDYINENRQLNIIMFEDPIEFIHKRKSSIVSQRVMKSEYSQSEQLKEVFRQDADVVCVGEIRDYQTMETVLTMCESGYFVIATLHTIDAVQTVERIANMFPAERKRSLMMQLSEELKGVICQTLLQFKNEPRLIPCREIMIPDDAIKNIIRNSDTSRMYGYMETCPDSENITFDQYLIGLYKAGAITKNTLKKNIHRKGFAEALLDNIDLD